MTNATTLEGKDMIILTRHEYEAFLGLKRVRTFVPTAAEKSALKTARADYGRKNYLSLNEFKRAVAGKNS